LNSGFIILTNHNSGCCRLIL